MGREIRVTGKGRKSYQPDMQRVRFSYEDEKNTYEEAMQLFKEKNKEISKFFEDAGFKNKELKFDDFSINKKYEDYKEEKDDKVYYKKRFLGYKLRLEYELEFKNDSVLLGKALNVISRINNKNADEYSSASISYFLDDEEKYKNEVLKIAINDCKEKANVLAETAGIKLGDIVLVDYSWNNVSVKYNRDSNFECFNVEDRIAFEGTEWEWDSFDINPKNIDIGVDVNMVFEIK